MNRYLFEYRYDGATYGIDIVADSLAEAKGRLSAMGMARYCGEIKATVNIPGGKWLAKLFGK
jgi:hypothetical protein